MDAEGGEAHKRPASEEAQSMRREPSRAPLRRSGENQHLGHVWLLWSHGETAFETNYFLLIH